MPDIKLEFAELKSKLEIAGFQFLREQKPHIQSKREVEYVFINPSLINKLESNGFKVKGNNFYIKPLTDNPNSEFGLVTGKSSPLYNLKQFCSPNSIDTFDGTPAWTNRENDNTLDNLLIEIQRYISSPSNEEPLYPNSYLFTWNSNKWNWEDLTDGTYQLENIGYYNRRWSCGNSKSIKRGDRIFLMKLGAEPRGLMGSGYAKSSCYVAPHWDDTPGKKTNYIDIEFDILIDPFSKNIFGKELLSQVDPNKLQQWFPQQSGISIKPDIIDNLESSWFDFLSYNGLIGNSFLSNDVHTEIETSFFEGKATEVLQTRYERNPQARKTCLAFHGYSCKICDFNFEYIYGEIGKGFIHVHHINPISSMGSVYNINPKQDLIPVCPNCHAMIHSKKPPFSIEEIQNFRKMKSGD